MAEGSDALLDLLDRGMKSSMPRCGDARVVVSSLKSSSFHEPCAGMSKRVLQLQRGHTVPHRARRVAWTHGRCDEDQNSGNEGNRRRRSRCPGAA